LRSARWLASSLKLAACCPVSGCWPSCSSSSLHAHGRGGIRLDVAELSFSYGVVNYWSILSEEVIAGTSLTGLKRKLEMWANAQRDGIGRRAEYSWHPLFNAAKFG